MKAKLIINEIVRGKDSAISSLGIGKEKLTYVYNKIVNEWPDLLKLSYPLNEETDKKITAVIPTIEKIFDVNASDIVCVNIYKSDISVRQSQRFDFSKWVKDLNDKPEIIYVAKTGPINDETGERIIKTDVKYYKEFNLIRLEVHATLAKDPKKVGYVYRYCMLK